MRSTVWRIKEPGRLFKKTRSRDPTYPFRWHHHDDIEIFVPVRGAGKVMAGDYLGDFAPGEAYLFGVSLPHAFYTVGPERTPGGMDAHVLNLSPELFTQVPELRELEPLVARARRGLVYGAVAARHVREALSPAAKTQARTLIQVLQVLDRLRQSRGARTLASVGFRSEMDDRQSTRVDTICGYLHAHHAEAVRLDDLAKHVHMTPAALCRFFKRATAKTVIEYVHELRVGRACRLLAETDEAITQIALRVGFQSLSNFNRTFRKLKRVTPREYRRRWTQA